MATPFGRRRSRLPIAGVGLVTVALLAAGCAGQSPLAFLKPKPAAQKAPSADKQSGKPEAGKSKAGTSKTATLAGAPKPQASDAKAKAAGIEPKKPQPKEPEPKKAAKSKTEPPTAEQLATAPLKPSDILGPGYWIQLAAHFKEEGGEAAWRTLSARHRGLLGGENHAVKRVDLGERGRFYRVLVGPYAARDSAQEKCAQLRRSKVACFLITRAGRVRGLPAAAAGETIAPKPPATSIPAAAAKPRNPAAPRKTGITATPGFVKPASKRQRKSSEKKAGTPAVRKKRAADLPFQRKDSIPGASK